MKNQESEFSESEHFVNQSWEGQLPAREYSDCTFESCDFSGAALQRVRFIDCTFIGCNLSLVPIGETSFQQVLFQNCKMLGLRFDQASTFAMEMTFQNSVLNDCVFYGLKLRGINFADCQLKGADFSQADLTKASFKGCDLMDATFDGTNLEGADFRESVNYIIDPENARLKKARFSLSQVGGLLHRYDILIDD